MALRVDWKPSALRDLKRLDPPTQERVIDAVDHYAATREGDVARLKRIRPPEYRLRIGGWRVRFAIARREGDPAMVVLHVRRRDKAYRP